MNFQSDLKQYFKLKQEGKDASIVAARINLKLQEVIKNAEEYIKVAKKIIVS